MDRNTVLIEVLEALAEHCKDWPIDDALKVAKSVADRVLSLDDEPETHVSVRPPDPLTQLTTEIAAPPTDFISPKVFPKQPTPEMGFVYTKYGHKVLPSGAPIPEMPPQTEAERPKTFEEARARGEYPDKMPSFEPSGPPMNPGMLKFPPPAALGPRDLCKESGRES